MVAQAMCLMEKGVNNHALQDVVEGCATAWMEVVNALLGIMGGNVSQCFYDIINVCTMLECNYLHLIVIYELMA